MIRTTETFRTTLFFVENQILLTDTLSPWSLFFYPPDSDNYNFAWLLQLTRKVLEFLETIPNSCVTSTHDKYKLNLI